MRYSADSNSSSMKQISVDAQDHPIEAVTLYNHRAEVRRIITLELNAGRNDFAIKNLPSGIVPDTLHFAGLSAGQASVVDTTCVIPQSRSLFGGFQTYKKPSSAQRKNEKIAELEAKKREFLRELSLINARSDVLLLFAKSLNGENTEPGDFVEFLEHFNAAGQSTLEATTRIEDGVREIDAAISRINADEESEDEEDKVKELSDKRKTKASVVLSAKEACTVKLSLTYVVNGASWSPSYELHATTDSKTQAIANTVGLYYHASIVQTTGEDWSDVQLTLSTASSTYGSYVPFLGKSLVKAGAAPAPSVFRGPMFGQTGNLAANNPMASRSLFGAAPATTNTTSGAAFSFGQAPGFGSATTASTAPATGLFGAASSNNPGTHPEPTSSVTGGLFSNNETPGEEAVVVESNPEMHALDRVEASVNDQALASTYSIETNVTVQSDAIPHRVTILSVQLGAKTQYIAVPKVSRAVYLSCKIINSTTHQFLPGPLVTYLDNSYIDRTSLPMVPLKGTMIKSLGTDNALHVTFVQTKKEAAKAAGFSQRNYTPITDIITIKNTRSFTIPRILVRHAIPTPEDDQFRVTLKDPEDMGALEPGKEYKLRENVKGRWMHDLTSGPEISGLVEWTIDNLAADAKEEIKMVYEIAAPQDVKWHQT